jgi:hypothetical protein
MTTMPSFEFCAFRFLTQWQEDLAIIRAKMTELEKLETHLSSALRKCNQSLKRQPPKQALKACPVLNQMSDFNGRKGH